MEMTEFTIDCSTFWVDIHSTVSSESDSGRSWSGPGFWLVVLRLLLWESLYLYSMPFRPMFSTLLIECDVCIFRSSSFLSFSSLISTLTFLTFFASNFSRSLSKLAISACWSSSRVYPIFSKYFRVLTRARRASSSVGGSLSSYRYLELSRAYICIWMPFVLCIQPPFSILVNCSCEETGMWSIWPVSMWV